MINWKFTESTQVVFVQARSRFTAISNVYIRVIKIVESAISLLEDLIDPGFWH